MNIPTEQALLDAFSIREKSRGSVKGKKVVQVGDIMHSRVALFSNIFCLQKLGAEVMVCGFHNPFVPKFYREVLE